MKQTIILIALAATMVAVEAAKTKAKEDNTNLKGVGADIDPTTAG